jgi:hypothetical protein
MAATHVNEETDSFLPYDDLSDEVMLEALFVQS